jgi:ribosomal RNA-processing protein 36
MSDNDNIYSSSDESNVGEEMINKKLKEVNNFDSDNDNSDFERKTNLNKKNKEEILEDIEEIEFGRLVDVQKKLEYDEKLKIKRNEKINKNKIKTKLESINKDKEKFEPKEFSALVKPKNKMKNIQKTLRRDPRFDDLSGQLKPELHEKRYGFVKEETKQYLEKLQKLKKDKKIVSETDYELYKRQMNLVKGWLKKTDYSENKNNIEKELKVENKKRIQDGKNPIFMKKNQLKFITAETYKEKRNQDDNKRFLKRKKHREMVQTRKDEKFSKHLNN